MKPILIFDTHHSVEEYCNFESSYIYCIDKNNLEEIERKVIQWYDRRQLITCDNEVLFVIITKDKLDDQHITIIEDVLSNRLQGKECKILLFSFYQSEISESYTIKINNQFADIFFLSNEDESGGLYIDADEKDKYHVVQILLEYLLENYVKYSQIKQNLNVKERENTFHSVGAIKYFLSKEILRKNAVKIIEAQNFSKFVFRENFDVNNSILNIINDEALAFKTLEKIKDNAESIINTHRNPPEIKIKVNDFIRENNIVNKDDELIIDIVSIQPGFENYYLHSENHATINSSLKSLRVKAKHQGNIEVKGILEKNSNSIHIAILDLSSKFKRNKILEIERDFINDFNSRIDQFKNNIKDFIDETILAFEKAKDNGTTNLENTIAILDFIVVGKSEYAENTSKNQSIHLEKLLATYFDKADNQFETQQKIFNGFKSIENKCDHLKNELKNNDKEIYDTSRDLLLFENQFQLGTLDDANKYSFLKLSFLPLSNITFLLVLNVLITGLCIYFIPQHYLFWGIPLILTNVFIIFSSIKKLKTKRSLLTSFFDKRERIISDSKGGINVNFAAIRKQIKHTYKNRLIKKFISIVQEERYNLVQMRKYFLFQYYNIILSIQKDINFNSNHILNVIDVDFVRTLILNVTPSSYFNDEKLVEYLHEYKEHNKDISYVFEEPDYGDILTIDYNTNEAVGMTYEHQNSDIQYAYDIVPKATPFAKAGTKKSIEINDIQQGEVGDCYFLAVLAGIAETMPSHIKNSIIYNKEEDYYSLRFYDNDKNEIYVNIDGKLYSKNGETDLVYARLNLNQKDIYKIWPALFEKAWAKLNGGYENIIGSTTERHITDFGLAITGNFMQAQSISEINTEEKLQKFLTKIGFMDKKTVVTLGSLQEKTPDSDSKLEIQHAYVLKEASKSKYTLYNPHGNNHFTDIDFNFLKNNFSYIYYFTLNDNQPIRPTKHLSITKKIHLFDTDLHEIFKKSDLSRKIEELNFFDLFWDHNDSNHKKIEEITKRSKALIPMSLIDKHQNSKDVFHILINESKADNTKEQITNELKYRIGADFNFTDTTDDIFSFIKIKLITKK